MQKKSHWSFGTEMRWCPPVNLYGGSSVSVHGAESGNELKLSFINDEELETLKEESEEHFKPPDLVGTYWVGAEQSTDG